MAAAYVTSVTRGGTPSAPLFVQKFAMTCDASYPASTGGYPLPTLAGTIIDGLSAITSSGYMATIDATNSKVKIGKFADSTEVWTELTNGTNLTGETVTITVLSY